MCVCLCVCLLQVCVHACFPLLLSCPSLPEVLYCLDSQTQTVQRRTLHVQQANPGTCKGETRRNRPLSKPKAVCKYSSTIYSRLRIYWPNSIITSCWVVVHADLFINAVSAMHLISAAAAAVGLQLSRYRCVREMLSPWLRWHRLNASLTKSPLSDFQNTLKS